MGWWWFRQQKSQEPCKKEACDIQACLSKNNFDPKSWAYMLALKPVFQIKELVYRINCLGCMKVIGLLQLCCEKCNNKSTHCAPLSELLKTSSKRFNAKI